MTFKDTDIRKKDIGLYITYYDMANPNFATRDDAFSSDLYITRSLRLPIIDLPGGSVTNIIPDGFKGGLAYEKNTQTIYYSDGRGWFPVNSLDITNAGTGVELLKIPEKEIRTLISSDSSVTLTQLADEVDIIANIPSVTLTSAGGTSLVNDGVGPALVEKGLTAGAGITLTDNVTDIQIDAPITTLTSAGGTSLVNDGTGPALAAKGLTAGMGIILTDNVTDIQIDSPGTAITLTSAGGTSLVNDGTGPTLVIKGLTAGTNITLTDNVTDIQIDSPITTLASAGGTSLVNDGVGPALVAKGLTAGMGITLTDNVTDIQIDSTGSSTTLTSAGGTSLVNDGTGPALATKGLTAGTGITLTDNVTDIQIDSSVTSLTSAGGTSLVNDGTGPTLATKGLTAGAGITLTDNVTDIQIDSSVTTLTSAGGTSLVNDGTGPTLATKGLTAGAGITLTDNVTNIQIDSTAPTTTLTSAGGTSLVNDGTGPTLATKGLTAGAGITLTDNVTDIQIDSSVTTLTSVGGTSLVNDGTGPTLATKGLTAGAGIIVSDNTTNVQITNTVTYVTAYGEISVSYTSSSPYVLGITTTPTLIASSTVAGDMFDFQRLSDGVLQYTGTTTRSILIEFDMDINPTDLVSYFTFELRKNGTSVIDTRNTFLGGSYEHIALQNIVDLATNDTVSIYCYHNGVGTINTNLIYYNLICSHQQLTSPLFHTTGQYSYLAGLTANTYYKIVWPTLVTAHPNVAFTPPSQFFTFNAAQAYTINFTALPITATYRLYVNGVLLHTDTVSFSIVLVIAAGDILSMDVSKGSGNATGNFQLSIVS